MSAKQEFFDALYGGDVALASRLWHDHNLDSNVRNSVTGIGGNPALGYVVHLKGHDFARELIRAGADVDARGESGDTPLWQVTDVEGVQLLVDAGADVNARLTRGGETFSRGATPLHRAARLGDAEMVQVLIEGGANVRSADRDGVTPLHYAKSANVARALIRAGADLDVRDKFNNTPRERLARILPGFQLDPSLETSMASPTPNVIDQGAASPPGAEAATVSVQLSDPSAVQTGRGEYLFVPHPEGASFAFISKEHFDQNVEFEDADALNAYLLDHEEDPMVRSTVYSTLMNARDQAEAEIARAGDRAAAGNEQVSPEENSISRVDREILSQKEKEKEKMEDERATTSAPSADQENAIQAAPGSRPPTPAGTGENTIQAAGPVATAATLTSEAVSANTSPPKAGPATLLNGRFIRRDNGEYFRIADGEESKRVALVDEVEKIRFVDKQMDAFQAAIELAKHKEWEAILVTGTEKFRSEAWYHAKLAGLEVVGYEPTEKDLETLRTAQARGDNTASASQQSADAASARLVAASRDVATEFALKHGAGVQAPNVENGRYVGKIVHETDHHVVQDVGKRVNVVHDKSRLDARELAKARDRREHVGVQYSNGRAALDLSEGKSKSQGLSR